MSRVLLFLQLTVQVFGANPSCASVGTGYNDPSNEAQHVTADDATACQEDCKRTEICAFFTWYPDSKGCWLQSSASVKNVTFDGVVSGPVRCILDDAKEQIKAGSQEVVNALNKNTGADFKWWVWVLIGLGASAVGLCCVAAVCCSGGKKSKRSSKVGARDVEKQASRAEEAPLVQAPASTAPTFAYPGYPATYPAANYPSYPNYPAAPQGYVYR